MNPITDDEIDRLAWHIEAKGLAGTDEALRRVVQRACRSEVSPVLVDVLADPAQPVAARIRAFGRVALQLAVDRRRPAPLAA